MASCAGTKTFDGNKNNSERPTLVSHDNPGKRSGRIASNSPLATTTSRFVVCNQLKCGFLRLQREQKAATERSQVAINAHNNTNSQWFLSHPSGALAACLVDSGSGDGGDGSVTVSPRDGISLRFMLALFHRRWRDAARAMKPPTRKGSPLYKAPVGCLFRSHLLDPACWLRLYQSALAAQISRKHKKASSNCSSGSSTIVWTNPCGESDRARLRPAAGRRSQTVRRLPGGSLLWPI